MKENVKFSITGALAGLANGFFGAGGGLFLVPLFIRWCKLPEKKAFATSVFVILPLSIASAIIYFCKGTTELIPFMPYLIGGFFGGLAGGFLLKKVPVNLLRRGFALLLLYGGVRAVLLL